MLQNLLWPGMFMLEMLIIFATFDHHKSNRRKFPPAVAVVARERLNVNRGRARASSNAETALDRAAHHRGGVEKASSAVVRRRPSWLDISGLGAPVKDCRDMKAPSTTSLSREFEFEFDVNSQIGEADCFQELCIGENNRRRGRAATCPVLSTNSMNGGTGVANGVGRTVVGEDGLDATTLSSPEAADDDLQYRVSSLLNDKSWDEVSESCAPSDLDSAAHTEMMRCATTGVVRGTASEDFSACLQRAFEAEQRLDEKREMAALDTMPEEAAEELELGTTIQIREKARSFLRELQEKPLPDLKDLVDGFASLQEMFDSEKEDQEVCRLAEVTPLGVETSLAAASAVAVLQTNSDALELISQELSMLLSKGD